MTHKKKHLTQEQAEKIHSLVVPGLLSATVEVSGGEWSQAFAFEAAGRHYISRFSPVVDDFMNDVYANRFKSERLPIPRTRQIGAAYGGFYAISDRAFGTMLDDLDKPSMQRMIPSLIAVVDAIRMSDVSESSGFGLWDGHGNGTSLSWKDFLLGVNRDEADSRIHGWTKSLAASPWGNRPFNQAYEVLEREVQNLPYVRALIHNDLLNFNVLTNDNEVSAVFDWGFSLYGDFVYEIAKFCFFGPIYEPIGDLDWLSIVASHYSAIQLTVPDLKRRLACSMIHIGLDAQSFYAHKADWAWLGPIVERTTEVAVNAATPDEAM